jgi:hypothetical protein
MSSLTASCSCLWLGSAETEERLAVLIEEHKVGMPSHIRHNVTTVAGTTYDIRHLKQPSPPTD